MTGDEEDGPRFRPRARLLQLLGDQLIGSPRLAIFELVKNAYDADATRAVVTMSRLDTPEASIEVVDDGIGMSYNTLLNIWLFPDTTTSPKIAQLGNELLREDCPWGRRASVVSRCTSLAASWRF